MIINTGFQPKRSQNDRLPPGQYETRDFPVLSLGPTPRIDKDNWQLELGGMVKNKLILNWQQLTALPSREIKTDIHCVTKWSKFDTTWTVIPLDEIIKIAEVDQKATHILAYCADGDTVNLSISEIMGDKGYIAYKYEGTDIPAEHGGPARLFVPHLYFWKSAKWLTRIEFLDHDQPGFWEVRGYHNHGDPWKEERYGDFL